MTTECVSDPVTLPELPPFPDDLITRGIKLRSDFETIKKNLVDLENQIKNGSAAPSKAENRGLREDTPLQLKIKAEKKKLEALKKAVTQLIKETESQKLLELEFKQKFEEWKRELNNRECKPENLKETLAKIDTYIKVIDKKLEVIERALEEYRNMEIDIDQRSQ